MKLNNLIKTVAFAACYNSLSLGKNEKTTFSNRAISSTSEKDVLKHICHIILASSVIAAIVNFAKPKLIKNYYSTKYKLHILVALLSISLIYLVYLNFDKIKNSFIWVKNKFAKKEIENIENEFTENEIENIENKFAENEIENIENKFAENEIENIENEFTENEIENIKEERKKMLKLYSKETSNLNKIILTYMESQTYEEEKMLLSKIVEIIEKIKEIIKKTKEMVEKEIKEAAKKEKLASKIEKREKEEVLKSIEKTKAAFKKKKIAEEEFENARKMEKIAKEKFENARKTTRKTKTISRKLSGLIERTKNSKEELEKLEQRVIEQIMIGAYED